VPHVVSPGPHAAAHPPSKHAWPAPHVDPQLPQLPGSELRFVHAAASPAVHLLSGAMHTVSQVPVEQTVPLGQTLPHAPQFALSVCTLAQ
jgi:hypothetical protein